jgi:hypothetical protein
MPPGITAPPMPSMALVVVTGAGCLLIGAVLNLWGRKAGRPLLALVVAAGAAASSCLVVKHFPLKNVWVVGAALALAGGLLAFLLGRLLWALTLGVVLAIVALGVVAHFGAGAMEGKPAWSESEFATFGAWCLAAADYLLAWLGALWRHMPVSVALAGLAPVVVCIAVELLLPSSILILASSAFGAAGVVVGAGLLVLACRADWARAWVDRMYIPAVVAAVLTLIGAAYQARTQLRGRPGEEEQEGEKKAGRGMKKPAEDE